MEFKEVKLSEICEIVMGQSPKSEFYNDSKGTPFLQGNRTFGHLYPIIDTYTTKVTKSASKGDLLMSVRAPVGELNLAPVDLCIGRGLCAIKPRINKYYVYYLLKEEIDNLESQSTGTIFSSVNKTTLNNLKVKIPKDTSLQDKIGDFLWAIDNKIQINNNITANLEKFSQTLFKRWFIDFEFPDEDGNPYKLSGGEMISSKVGQIPSNFSLGELESLIDIYNTKRKPLSRIERDKQEKIYPYYGATKIIDYVDDYKFNGKYVLVGEDGTVKTDNGAPFTQYVYGKFWVSNHAHILKGKNISDEILLLILNNIDIDPYITGAVQPKLNKKNLLNIETIIAPIELYTRFNKIIEPYFKKIIEIEEESLLLRELRDTLLPKLMSGEIELPEELEV